ncbi:hypothetical protein BDR05DRAFT_963309, partial [Suillus weaverae]
LSTIFQLDVLLSSACLQAVGASNVAASTGNASVSKPSVQSSSQKSDSVLLNKSLPLHHSQRLQLRAEYRAHRRYQFVSCQWDLGKQDIFAKDNRKAAS